MAQDFYTSDAIFDLEKERIFGRDWFLAGHVSEIGECGDYLLFDLLEDSVIVCRDIEGDVRAYANVCRHRGSRLCLDARGNARRFTCPYHAWAYNLDGSLFHARGLDPSKDRENLGLHRVAVEVLEGLIYVSLAKDPPDFEPLRQALTPCLTPFDLANTRIAHRASYGVAANWKLLLENYNECYHCASAHPEFSRSHAIHMPDRRVEPLNAKMAKRSTDCGIPTTLIDRIGTGDEADYAYNRYALLEGFVTGSEDGGPLAPLLGAVEGYDGGASDTYVGLFNPMLIYCDHAVLYRFHPVDKDSCTQEIIWLVRAEAKAGRDYDLERLIWLWDVTTRADKRIVEANARGVASRHYAPGPLAEMEGYVQRFIETYQTALQQPERRDE
jgi:Rieske 2Fe-2S family protein